MFCKQSRLSTAPGKWRCYWVLFIDTLQEADFCSHILKHQPRGRNNFEKHLSLMESQVSCCCWNTEALVWFSTGNSVFPKLRGEGARGANLLYHTVSAVRLLTPLIQRENPLVMDPCTSNQEQRWRGQHSTWSQIIPGRGCPGPGEPLPYWSSPLGQDQRLGGDSNSPKELCGGIWQFHCFPHLLLVCITEKRQHKVEKAHVFRVLTVYTVCHARQPNYFPFLKKRFPWASLNSQFQTDWQLGVDEHSTLHHNTVTTI